MLRPKGSSGVQSDAIKSRALEKAAVEGFGNAVVLRGVMCGEAALCAFLLEEFSKLEAGILTATIRAKDFRVVLSVRPSHIGLVGMKGFFLRAEGVDICVMREVICESDVITAAPRLAMGDDPHKSV